MSGSDPPPTPVTPPEDRDDRSLAELRRAFDHSFALPPAGAAEAVEEFVAIRLGPDRYALAIHDIASLEPDRTVVPLPSDRPGLLGVAGIRGRLVPVFSLALLLGQPHRGEGRQWLALAGREEPTGFAFDGFDGHLKIPRHAMDTAGAAGLRPYVRQILRRGDEPPRLVIDIPRLVATACAAARTRTA